MTSLIPGHKPPQVMIAQEVLAGSKKILRRDLARQQKERLELPKARLALVVDQLEELGFRILICTSSIGLMPSPAAFRFQKDSQPGDRSSLRSPAIGQHVDGGMVAYANPSSEPVLRLEAIDENLSGLPQCFFWFRIGHWLRLVVNDHIISGASSSTTSFGLLSGRTPRNVVCRICPSLVHSANDTSQTNSGFTH
jgi:hypothetical protein